MDVSTSTNYAENSRALSSTPLQQS